MNEKILLTKLFRLNLIESPLLLHCVEAQLQLRQENRLLQTYQSPKW